MKLAINAVGIKIGGTAAMLQDILDTIEHTSSISTVFVFCSPGSKREAAFSPSKKVIELPQAEMESNYARRIWWLESGLARATQRLRPDCLLSMTNTGIGPAGLPTAVFVMQALPFSSEALNVCGVSLRTRMRMVRCLMSRSCRRASAVFTQTPTMKAWLCKAFGLCRERVFVTLPQVRRIPVEGDDGPVQIAMKSVPANRRLLYVGSDLPYKNLQSAYKATKRVQEKYPGVRLFVTLPPTHAFCDGEVVRGLGYVGGAGLRAAYKLATLFVMPSLVECGNLTVLEAMSLGTPVLVADRPYAHDTCEDAAVFFDPLDSEDLGEKIERLLDDECERSNLIRRGSDLVERRERIESYATMIDHLVRLAGQTGQVHGA